MSASLTEPGAFAPPRSARPNWRQSLAPYAKPDMRRSVLDLATSVVPYLALSVAMYAVVGDSLWLVLALAVPASGFLLRTFIVFHDCTHGSFLPGKRANMWCGVLCGLLVYANFLSWRHSHQVHHASAGDLDRRGTGDVPTWTVAEYRAKPRHRRAAYWLFRHPLVMFGVGWLWALVIQPRLWSRSARPRIKRNVIGTNVALAVLVGTLVSLVGCERYLLVQFPTVALAGSIGVWLFYVQHQFEDVYWESSENWSYADAALRGSSYLNLPQPLQFFTGNIGLHHVHHLQARIPNYNLQRAHDETPIFHDVPVLTLWDGIRSVRLKLWDEEADRLVTFAEARGAGGSARRRRSVRDTGRPAQRGGVALGGAALGDSAASRRRAAASALRRAVVLGPDPSRRLASSARTGEATSVTSPKASASAEGEGMDGIGDFP